jgi:hypothetical protein
MLEWEAAGGDTENKPPPPLCFYASLLYCAVILLPRQHVIPKTGLGLFPSDGAAWYSTMRCFTEGGVGVERYRWWWDGDGG